MTARTDAVWLNGVLTPRAAARLDPLAHGFLYGAGVYDSFPLRRGIPIALERHLNRLSLGAARLGLAAPLENTVRAAIQNLSAALALDEGRARITLAAGSSPNVYPGSPEETVTLITLAPVSPPKASAAVTVTRYRRNQHSPLAGIKHTACAENLLAQREALAAGFDEALFVNTGGQLCEGAFSNVFLVRDGQVLTPPLTSGCLAGVTREVVLELATAHGISCAERELFPDDVSNY
jgi:branched-chain amino acid aminotransferase